MVTADLCGTPAAAASSWVGAGTWAPRAEGLSGAAWDAWVLTAGRACTEGLVAGVGEASAAGSVTASAWGAVWGLAPGTFAAGFLGAAFFAGVVLT